MNRLAKNALAALFGIVVAVVLIEVFFYAAPGFLPHNVRFVSTSVFDDDLRQAFKPNIDTLQKLDDGILWELKTTDLGLGGIGFRDDGIESDDVYAVVVGDSHVYGHGVGLESVWTEILERETGKEVVNMGQPAAFPGTELKVLERYGTGLKPDVVLFAIFQNDWVDAAGFESEVSDGFTNAKRVLDSYSSAYRLLRFVVNLPKYESSYGFDRYTNGSVDMYLYPLHMGPAVDDSNPSIKFGEQSMREAMLRAAAFAESNGIKIIFVVFPSKEQVYWNLVSSYAPDPEANNDRLNEAVDEICQENGLMCLNLNPAFVENRDRQLFFTSDGHPNADGHRVVAEAIHEYLSENNFLN